MCYDILSICGELGSLHHHTPPHTNPSKTQQNCRPANKNCTALCNQTLVTSSQARNNKNTNLTLHSLNRLPTRNFTPPEPISCVATSNSSNLLFAGGTSGRCYVWYVFTGRLFAVWDAHVGSINAASFCDDDEAILTVGADAAARLFLLKDVTGTNDGRPDPCLELAGHTLPITCLAMGYAGVSARVVTASVDRSARVWHLASATCIATIALSAPAVDVVLTFDEAVVFVALTNGYIVCAHLHSLPLGSVTASSRLKRIPAPTKGVFPKCLALSPEIGHLIVGYTDGIVRIYDSRSLQMISVYAKHNTTAPITAVLATSGSSLPEKPLFERVPERVMDKSLGETFIPLVDMSNGCHTRDAAWSVMSETLNMVFGTDDSYGLENGDHNSSQEKDMEKRLQRESDLLFQIQTLRSRNQELQSAAAKLIQVAESEFL
ncbi:unnamed protein product [Agarophyton chilense]